MSATSRFCILTFLITSAATQAGDYFPPPDSQGGWRTLKEGAEIHQLAGMKLSRLEQAFDFTQRSTQNGGLLVVRHGYLVFEKYFGRAHRNANPDMASTGKAYTSIACGIMLQEFRSQMPDGLDTKVFTEKYLPEAFPLDDPRKAEITLGQLLCMTAGYHGEGTSPASCMAKSSHSSRLPARTFTTWTDPRSAPFCGRTQVPAIPTPRPPRTLRRSCFGTSPAWSCRIISMSAWLNRWAGDRGLIVCTAEALPCRTQTARAALRCMRPTHCGSVTAW